MNKPSSGFKDQPSVEANQRVVTEVMDALTLVDYAVASGVKGFDGHALSRDDVGMIQIIAAKLGIFRRTDEEPRNGGRVSAAEWIDFELAYYNLATALSPVTAETLRNTEGESEGTEDGRKASAASSRARRLINALLGYSPAHRFSRGLCVAAVAFAVFVLVAEWRINFLSQDTDTSTFKAERELLRLLMPWAYGGLGSCVYLLKNAHAYIYLRCFDLRRKPEYINRIILGTISGGAIMLFANQLAGDDGAVVQLGSAALGFLAGYCTDFLFSTVERIIAAVLPKVDVESAVKARAAPRPQKGDVKRPADLADADEPDEERPGNGSKRGRRGVRSERRAGKE